MDTRTLGATGLRIAPLILGGNVFGWTIDQRGSFAVLDAFFSCGYNCIDTSDSYSTWVPGNSGGESETIIGNWMKLRGNRDRIIIATKVGSEMGPGRKGLAKSYILAEAEASLSRLQTDYIDLYQTHRDDPATPVEETLEAYGALVRQGKVRHIGASNLDAARLTASCRAADRDGLPRYATMQPQYNLCERAAYERELEGACRSLGLAVIPYYPLASGFLTGKYRSVKDLGKSPRGTGVRKYLNVRGFGILAALDTVAHRYAATPAAVALAWLLGRPGIAAPIVSATSPAQWNELTAAPGLRLDADARGLLDGASA